MKFGEVIEYQLKRRVENPKRLNPYFLHFFRFIDSVRVVVFFSTLNDLILFTSHEILHHDMEIEQSSSASLSYFFSILIFNFCIVDLLRTYKQLRCFNPVEFAILNKLILKYKRKMKIFKEDSRLKIKKADEIVKFGYKQKMKKFKNFISFCNTKILYKFGMTNLMMIEGLKLEHLGSKSGFIFLRFYQIIRTIIFELAISSLQMLPKLQVSVILLVQTLFLVFTIYCVFYKKCFEGLLWPAVFIVDEFSIWLFLVVVALLEFFQRNSFSVDFWMRLQIICICLIVISTVANMVVMTINFFFGSFFSFFGFFYYRGGISDKLLLRDFNEINEVVKNSYGVDEENLKKIEIKIIKEFELKELSSGREKNRSDAKIPVNNDYENATLPRKKVEKEIENNNSHRNDKRIKTHKIHSRSPAWQCQARDDFTNRRDKFIPKVPYGSTKRKSRNKKRPIFKKGFQELWDAKEK